MSSGHCTLMQSTNSVASDTIDHFTVVYSVTWPLNGSEAGADLALIKTSLLLLCKRTSLKELDLRNKSSEVHIKTRSPSASLPFKGQVTE